jgi:putative ABC transport system permease protein
MLRHLLKLIWKRKSRNMMLSLEILLAFLVVFAIAAFGVRNYQLYQLPTGFAWQDQWSVEIHTAQDIESDPVLFDKLKRGLLELPEVEAVAFATFPLYEMSRYTGDYALPDRSHRVNIDSLEVSDDFFAATNMTLTEGRWFSSIDDGDSATPVVINRRMAALMFPGRSALGQLLIDAEAKGEPRRFRVTGVVEHFRSHGEYMDPVPFMLPRFRAGVSKNGMQAIVLKLKPGTPRIFESKLNARLKQIRSDWSYGIQPMGEARRGMLKAQMMPLMILSVIAAFLLLMVAFGLFGVLWQNTTQRIPELGLRRALGADAAGIYYQIISEQILLSTVAIAAGLVLLVQLPLTGALGESLDWKVFIVAAALSMGIIYLLSLLCSLYPGWRAARLSPTEALHYE